MKIISPQEFDTIVNNSEFTLLKTTYDRPKLLESTDGKILKIFYPRNKKISSNQFKPYALRFAANTKRLKDLGFNSPTIIDLYYCPHKKTHILWYEKIPGVDTRQLLLAGNLQMVAKIAEYVASLHAHGIFFRSLHLENLLYDPTGYFSLLDIVDIKFKSHQLNLFLCYRNLRHMFFIKDDRAFWTDIQKKYFLTEYLKHSKASCLTKKLLQSFLG